jgi:hypothetical protein
VANGSVKDQLPTLSKNRLGAASPDR